MSLSYRLLAALAQIIVLSIYVGTQLRRALALPHMHRHQRGVACVRLSPYHVIT